MLKILEATEVLPVTVFNQLGHHRLVADIVSVLEVLQSDKKTDRQTRPTEVLGVEETEFSFKERPVNSVRQSKQRMSAVQNLVQA